MRRNKFKPVRNTNTEQK